VGIPLVSDREATNRDPADVFDAGGQSVGPRDVIAGTRRQYLDGVMSRKAFGNVSGVLLGPAVDVRAVALDDEGEPHWSVGSAVFPVVGVGFAVSSRLGSRGSGAAVAEPPGYADVSAAASGVASTGIARSLTG
jgi:hypothetical protein